MTRHWWIGGLALTLTSCTTFKELKAPCSADGEGTSLNALETQGALQQPSTSDRKGLTFIAWSPELASSSSIAQRQRPDACGVMRPVN